MSLTLRILLIVFSVLVMFFVLRKIRKTDFVIEDSFFWIIFCLVLLVMSIFPNLCYLAAKFLGIESPSNLIFLVVIFLLLVKVFLLTVKVSKMQMKLNNLIQKYAIDSNEKNKK